MELMGKKMIFLGDSITCGVGTTAPDKVYWKQIEKKSGAVCQGLGVSGTRIAKQIEADPDAPHDRQHFITRINLIESDTDIIGVLGGINDFSHGDAPLGNMSDRRQDTFYGACHLLYSNLLEKFPTAFIFVMTPLHCAAEDDMYYNSVGKRRVGSLLDYVNIIFEVAAKYSLPVLDLYRKAGIQPEIKKQRDIYMPDGIHPSDAGNERIADKIITFLKQN